MKAELLTCGYSFHMDPFYVSTKSGLQYYLFRLQTEGTCEALVDGRMVPIEAGHFFFLNQEIPMNCVLKRSHPFRSQNR